MPRLLRQQMHQIDNIMFIHDHPGQIIIANFRGDRIAACRIRLINHHFGIRNAAAGSRKYYLVSIFIRFVDCIILNFCFPLQMADIRSVSGNRCHSRVNNRFWRQLRFFLLLKQQGSKITNPTTATAAAAQSTPTVGCVALSFCAAGPGCPVGVLPPSRSLLRVLIGDPLSYQLAQCTGHCGCNCFTFTYRAEFFPPFSP